jgi:hypothetical protein
MSSIPQSARKYRALFMPMPRGYGQLTCQCERFASRDPGGRITGGTLELLPEVSETKPGTSLTIFVLTCAHGHRSRRASCSPDAAASTATVPVPFADCVRHSVDEHTFDEVFRPIAQPGPSSCARCRMRYRRNIPQSRSSSDRAGIDCSIAKS